MKQPTAPNDPTKLDLHTEYHPDGNIWIIKTNTPAAWAAFAASRGDIYDDDEGVYPARDEFPSHYLPIWTTMIASWF